LELLGFTIRVLTFNLFNACFISSTLVGIITSSYSLTTLVGSVDAVTKVIDFSLVISDSFLTNKSFTLSPLILLIILFKSFLYLIILASASISSLNLRIEILIFFIILIKPSAVVLPSLIKVFILLVAISYLDNILSNSSSRVSLSLTVLLLIKSYPELYGKLVSS
jgi:hypothetical protein